MANKLYLLLISAFIFSLTTKGEVIDLQCKNTITVLEVNSGDQVNYTLQNGRTVQIKLLKSESKIVFTSLKDTKKGSAQDGTIYEMECTLEIDGQEMKMVRYVPVQQTFYEPYIVNGLMIWFDGLKSLDKFFNENHGDCLPQKEARFAFQDAGVSICPTKVSNWVDLPSKTVTSKDSYMGLDPWMGPYFGADLHGGLDINMPSNTALYAPIDFDNNYYFNSVEAGDNNNRWRGIKYWENGDTWILQTHHLNQLLVPELQPIKKGQKYAYTAGTWAGWASHTHFVFKTKQPGFDEYFMDPWVIFWQIIQNNREKEQAVKAWFEPLSPAKTGEKIMFNATKSRAGVWGGDLEYFWDFGDGYSSVNPNPEHIYSSPGIYPVTLLVKDGHEQHAARQFITINGEVDKNSNFNIFCDNEPSFRISKNWKTLSDYSNIQAKNTVCFYALTNNSSPLDRLSPKTITIHPRNIDLTNVSDGAFRIEAIYKHGKNWLNVEKELSGNGIILEIQPDISMLKRKEGFYEAGILIHYQGLLITPQFIRVKVNIEKTNPDPVVIIDNSDSHCTYSNFFWLKPEFYMDWSKGYEGDFLVNRNNNSGEFVRFLPNIMDGSYTVSLYGKPYSNEMLLRKTEGFNVIIKHKNGIDKKWIEPKKSPIIGDFEFQNGDDNYIEIISDDSKGLILVDAIKFDTIK